MMLTPSSFLTSLFSMHLCFITVAFVNNRDAFCGDFSASNTKVLNLLSSSSLMFLNLFPSFCWLKFAADHLFFQFLFIMMGLLCLLIF